MLHNFIISRVKRAYFLISIKNLIRFVFKKKKGYNIDGIEHSINLVIIILWQ